MTDQLRPFDAANYIKNPEDVGYYLEACIDEDPGDGSMIRLGLQTLARSKGMTAVARDAGINRSWLYDAFGPEHDPSFGKVLKIIRALGLKLRIEPVGATEPAEVA